MALGNTASWHHRLHDIRAEQTAEQTAEKGLDDVADVRHDECRPSRRAAAWHRDGHDVALAMVMQTWGSSPRPVGSVMIIRGDLAVEGSVSGGCVEGGDRCRCRGNRKRCRKTS